MISEHKLSEYLYKELAIAREEGDWGVKAMLEEILAALTNGDFNYDEDPITPKGDLTNGNND